MPAPPPAIPPAPPPPPPVKTRSYFERFVAQPLTTAYTSRPPSVPTAGAQSRSRSRGRGRGRGPLNPLVAKASGIRAGRSHDAAHKTGLDISALDVNRERSHAVLAGREILKTVRVQDAKIVDDTNLRAAVLSQPDSHARHRDGLGIHDVKWSHGRFSSHIATAAANGKVLLYDLNRASVELTRLHEHSRQVHKLAFNPHQGHLLLSASHDATVRLWDLRDLRRDAVSCRSRDQYAGFNGGIRDVQWSPTNAVEFAFGTDNGTVQRWDFLHNKAPKQNITAHDQRMCTSIDWHPDGKHLLTAGVDRTVKIWDFSVDGRRQKPSWVLNTPYPVHRARWRPPYWSDACHDKGAYQCTQLATSYDREHAVIHIWDFRRPHLPFREIDRFATAPSDLLWHSRDTLWTVGKEGIFQQNDVRHAPKTVERRNLQALALSSSGEIGGIVQKRPRRPSSISLASSDSVHVSDAYDDQSCAGKDSFRSAADDSVDDSFLLSSARWQHSSSSRYTKSLASAPPSDVAPKVALFTDSMTSHSETLKPNQVAFRGTLPGSPNVQVFAYLAQKYKAISVLPSPASRSVPEVTRVFEQNAEYAQRAALYRLAQTWRVVGASMAVTMNRRAESDKNHTRVPHKSAASAVPLTSSQTGLERQVTLDRRHGVPHNLAVQAISGALEKSGRNAAPSTGQALNGVESTSNSTTPLARPTTASPVAWNETQWPNPPDDLNREETSSLPFAGSSSSRSTANRSRDDTRSLATPQSTFAYSGPCHDADNTDERRAWTGSGRASLRTPRSFGVEDGKDASVAVPLALEEHRSGDTSAMFSACTNSYTGSLVPKSAVESSSLSHGVGLGRGSANLEKLNSDSFEALSAHHHHHHHHHHHRQTHDVFPHFRQHDPAGTRQTEQKAISNDRMLVPSTGDRVEHQAQPSHRNNQLTRHDSSASDAYSSSRDSAFASVTSDVEMDASGTIVPDVADDEITSSDGVRLPASLPHAAKSGLHSSPPATTHRAGDEEASPYSMVELLNALLAHHTRASDAQFSSLLLLLLAPLLPQAQHSSSTASLDVAEVLGMFTDIPISLGLTSAQSKALLSARLSHVIATGINPYQAEAVLHTYHGQLHSLALFNAAASLRLLAYPTYPAVYEQALKDTQLGLMCLSCQSPINNPKDKMRCESCRRAQAPCSICWGRYPAFEFVPAKKKARTKRRSNLTHAANESESPAPRPDQSADCDNGPNGTSQSAAGNWSPPTATLWTWCPLCGHGGHISCLSTWFADHTLSDGACATEGCLCDCVKGRHRDKRMQEALRKRAQRERSRAVRKGNDWKAHESKAVLAVRGIALNGTSTD